MTRTDIAAWGTRADQLERAYEEAQPGTDKTALDSALKQLSAEVREATASSTQNGVTK